MGKEELFTAIVGMALGIVVIAASFDVKADNLTFPEIQSHGSLVYDMDGGVLPFIPQI